MRFLAAVTSRVADRIVDAVLRNHDQRIRELTDVPIVGGRLVRGVELPNATDTPIAHGLGRRAIVFTSPPRGGAASTGRITDVTGLAGVAGDSASVVVLRATGWGVAVTVDLWIF